MTSQSRWSWAVGVALLSVIATVSGAFGQAADVRWDIVSLNFGPPVTVSPGGTAAALAVDGSKIVLTGSGNFVAPAGSGGTSSAVTGGGAWQTFSPSNVPTGSGTYSVTGLVRWEEAPGSIAPGTIDMIGNPADARSGVVVLRIEYSDGSHGVLTVNCHLAVGSPATVAEGVAATKGFVDYFRNQAPVPGVNANRTVFHLI